MTDGQISDTEVIFSQLHPSYQMAVKKGLLGTITMMLQQKAESDAELKRFEEFERRKEEDYGSW
jgi:hypothetical protein